MFTQILRRIVRPWSVALVFAAPLLVGCAHMPAPSLSLAPTPTMPMAMGARVAPPAALLDYCGRQPAACGMDPSAPKQKAAAAKAYWASVFAAGPRPAGARPTDWSAVADQIQASPAAIAEHGAGGADKPAVSDDAFLNTYGGPGMVAALAEPAPPAPAAARPFAIAWSAPTRKLVTKINLKVNHALIERSDAEAHGQDDYWTETALTGPARYADCEDYALTKKKALIAAGIPGRALSMAIVRTQGGTMHAVLVVSTDQGDFVLDNLDPFIRAWTDTSYHWVSRQSGDDPFTWYRPAFQPESARRLAALPARAPGLSPAAVWAPAS